MGTSDDMLATQQPPNRADVGTNVSGSGVEITSQKMAARRERVKENKWEGMGRNGMRINLERKYNIESRVSSFTAETIRELTACDGVKSSSSDSSSCNGRWPNMANQKSEKRKNEREKSGAILHQCLCNTKKCLVPSLVVLLWLCLFL